MMRSSDRSSAGRARRLGAAWCSALTLAAAGACAGAHPRTGASGAPPTQGEASAVARPSGAEGDPKAALQAFLEAARQRDFDTCYWALCAPLRQRYTPERLAEDFQAAREFAEDKLARARAALAQEPRLIDGRAELPISEHRAVRLVRESGTWKIAALE